MNIRARLAELPKAAYDRLTHKRVGIPKSTFYQVLKEEYVPQTSTILKFCEVLKCSVEEFMDPDFRFRDFRTAREIREDQDK